jgi:hypothetical protein
MARGWLVSVGVLVLVACSGRTKDPEPGSEAGAAGDSSTGGDAGRGGGAATSGGGVATTGGRSSTTGGRAGTGGSASSGGSGVSGGTGGTTGECVIAYRHDRCCPPPVPVRREELESDPCLEEWSPLSLGPSSPVACEFPSCDAPCAPLEPESRVTGLGADGACRFEDECESEDDCAALNNTQACCNCPLAFPSAWIGRHECLVGGADFFPRYCRKGCGSVVCGSCPPTGALHCVTDGDAFARCGFAPFKELGPDECAAEQACAENPMHGCTVCVARGETACGGPAPPPDECASDAECRERADNLNCEQVPCQNKRCVQGCLTDEDCGPSEICDDYRCKAAPCAADGTCTPNHACVADLCVRLSCTTSAECGDFCVNGQCQEYPGDCREGCAP